MIPFELSTEESALVRGGFFRRSRENKGKTNMKQLKFMLAAATAIGLATAAQAAPTDKTLVDEDFNGYTTDQVVTEIEGFSFPYEGKEGDNESAIVAESDGDMALKVNTGTDPLLRALEYDAGSGAQDINLADETAAINYLNIDATVQFTVTPIGDTVTATANDKLMIFLQEVAAAEEGGESTTKLKVKALQYKAATEGAWNEELGAYDDPVPAIKIAKDWDVEYTDGTAVAVEANKPYNLSVKTELVDGVPMFKISLGGKEIKPVENLHLAAANSSYFPSLLGPDEKALTYVGFAGEGTVDDLVVTKNYDVSAVDFTFAWTTEGISAVTYTLGSVVGSPVTSGTSIAAEPGAKITIAVKPADWYALVDNPQLEYTVPAEAGDPVSLDGLVKKLANVTTDDAGNVTVEVTESTKPADVYVNAGSFAAEGTEPEQLSKALNWALSKGGKTTPAAAGALVSGLDFADGEEETDAEKAYLLDCTEAQLSGENGEIAKFKFAGFDPATGAFQVGTEKKVDDKAAYGNGYVEVRGSATVGGAYNEAADKSKHSFFKAFLVPFAPTK